MNIKSCVIPALRILALTLFQSLAGHAGGS